MRRLAPLALALGALAALPAWGWAQQTLGSVELELLGPTEGVVLGPAGAPSRVEVELADGERRRLRVPFLRPVAREGLAAPRLLSGVPAPESIDAVRLPGRFEDLPLALRLRSLPPLETRVPTPLPLHVAWLAAATLLALGLRRRPLAAALAGGAAALVLFVLPGDAPAPAARLVRVLEGDGESGRWLEVRAAAGRLELGADERGWLEHRPPDRPLSLRSFEERGALRSVALAPGATLHARRERVAPVRPTRASSGGYRFLRVWLREPGEGWEARGPWSGEVPLPATAPGGGDPPGWLAAGLPQGVPVLVGELEAPEGERGWLRLAPF